MSKPLKANVTKVFAEFANPAQKINVTGPLPTFRGKPLYCHADSQNGLLTIAIDEVRGNSGVVANPAQDADVTITVGASQPFRVHLAQINFPGNELVALVVKLTPGLDQAFLFIEPQRRTARPDDIDFGFILVQEPTNQLYRVEFVDPPLVVGKDEEDTSSTLIPADHSQQPGVIGPMGITMP